MVLPPPGPEDEQAAAGLAEDLDDGGAPRERAGLLAEQLHECLAWVVDRVGASVHAELDAQLVVERGAQGASDSEEVCEAVEAATAYWNKHKHPFVWGWHRRHRPMRKPGIAAAQMSINLPDEPLN